jgi:hypothetical protein
MTTHRLPFRTQPTPAFDFSHLPFVVAADDTLQVEFPEVGIDLARLVVGPMSLRLRGACPATVSMSLGARLERPIIERLLPAAAADMASMQATFAAEFAKLGAVVDLGFPARQATG